MRYFLFLAVLLGITIPSVFAEPFQNHEAGSDYDKYYLGIGEHGFPKYQYVVTAPKLEDSPNHFVNFKVFDKTNTITFESAQSSYNFDKQSCTLRLYDDSQIDSGETPFSTMSNTLKEAQNGTDDWSDSVINSESCQISYSENENGITVTAKKEPLNLFGAVSYSTIYDVDWRGKTKFTYQITNNDHFKTATKFGSTQVFTGSFLVTIGNHTYNLNDFNDILFTKEQLADQIIIIKKGDFTIQYDPQNYIHDYLWALKIQKNKMILDFTYAKGSLPVGETLLIDPTFTVGDFNDGSVYGGPAAASANCGVTFGANTTNSRILKRASGDAGSADTCQGAWVIYNVTPLNDNALLSAAWINYTQGWAAGTPESCEWRYNSQTAGPNGNQATYDNIVRTTGTNFTKIKTADTNCKTTGATSVTFNQTALTLFQQDIRAGGDNKIAIGWWFNSPVRPAAVVATNDNILETSTLSLVYEISTYVTVNSTEHNTANLLTVGKVTQTNSSTSQTKNTNAQGKAIFSGLYGLNNFTDWDRSTNMITNKTWNYNMSLTGSPRTLNIQNSIFRINCPSNGNGEDAILEMNGTQDNRFSLFTTPSCNSNNIILWNATSLKSGTANRTQTTFVKVQITNTTAFGTNAGSFKQNGTLISTSYSGGNITSSSFNFGSGQKTIFKYFNMTLNSKPSAAGAVDVHVVGDTARVNMTLTGIFGQPAPRAAQLRLFDNGTLIQTQNINVQLGAGSYQFSAYPFWVQMTTENHHSFSGRIYLTSTTGNYVVNTTSSIVSREYDPDYHDAVIASQGIVNYTYGGGFFKVNRDDVPSGTTWQIECRYRTWADTFLNSRTGGTWNNVTTTGFYEYATAPTNQDLYVECYNEDLLFNDAVISANFTNYIQPGIQIFDALGGFLGAPSVLIFILAIFSWGTGRNFPIVIVIGVSALGIMGALGLLILEQQIWSIIFVLAGLAIFGIRKFF